MERKLVSIRKIAALDPIPGADLIEVATVDGWKLVVKKNEFKVGDLCVYYEIDSFLPETDPRYTFLMKSGVREFEGVRGHKLRTIKLRGQISQGLALPVIPAGAPELMAKAISGPAILSHDGHHHVIHEGMDVTEILGIKKYEAPIPASLSGQVAGGFPSFIKKTDQERCQNMVSDIFGYDLVFKETSFDADKVPHEAIAAGRLKIEDGKVYSVHPPKASRDDRYEVTMKLDGSSMTIYHNNGEMGVCSRNLELKINEENQDNTFVKLFLDADLQNILHELGNIAIQGELMGPGIQGNRENLKTHKFFIFDAQDLDRGVYFTQEEREALVDILHNNYNVPKDLVDHVPVLHKSVTLPELGISSVDDLLKYADGPSLNNPVREGLVFKRVDGGFSFKAISNIFLQKEKD